MPVSPEQAARARAARAEKRRREAEAAVAAKADGSLRTAWQTVVGAQYDRAVGFEAHTPAASFVARAIGAFVEVREPATVSESSLPSELRLVVELVRERAATTPALAERLAQLARGDTG